jgi:hypothetical protein
MKNRLYDYRHRRRRKVWPVVGFAVLLIVLEAVVVLFLSPAAGKKPGVALLPSPTPTAQPMKAGEIIATDSIEHFTAAQTTALIRHNYPAGVPGEAVPITKTTFHYRSQLPDGKFVTVYGRSYLPDDARTGLPIFAFAPGTTGIGDQCAASLEVPAKANWANYDSHMAAYAAQGYAGVTTDYEGMRDTGRLHHYMVGELEGRALIDSVRALRQLPSTLGRLNSDTVFFAGYSQGGHAAFWADKVAAKYAPDVKASGVVGFGPVMSVKDTLADIVRGANINWFGPNVLLSYEDYYKARYPGIILPAREATLGRDVTAHCIDTDLSFWGHTPVGLYTPEFIQSAQTNRLATDFPKFNEALESNTVGLISTSSAKRINQGALDNVVLPSQQTGAVAALCSSSTGSVEYVPYPTSTHYTTMLNSFNDTLAWMKAVGEKQIMASTCS